MDKGHKGLSVRKQAKLLEVSRSSQYYAAVGESQQNLSIMKLMDAYHIEHPTTGVLGMQDMLRYEGYQVNHKRIRKLLHLMDIRAIFPRKCLSRCHYASYIYPYLLKPGERYENNQVWSIDISYIPMKRGFMYLTAIIDVSSRFIVGWALSNTLEARICTGVLSEAIAKYGKPDIVNSDQGAQFTCPRWVNMLKDQQIKISMDGKGRAKDNIWIERFWKSIKQEYIYLNPADDGLELYRGISQYMHFYNYKRAHQGIGRIRPAEKYEKAA